MRLENGALITRCLTTSIVLLFVSLCPLDASADVSHRLSASFQASWEGRWGVAYEVGWPGDATEPRMRSRLVLRGHASVSYTSAQLGADDDGVPVESIWGVTATAGLRVGWAGVRLVNGRHVELGVGALIAPVVTVFDGWATRFDVAVRPGLELRYGAFAFSFGLALEIVVATTGRGPWDVDANAPVLLPAADIGLGVAF